MVVNYHGKKFYNIDPVISLFSLLLSAYVKTRRVFAYDWPITYKTFSVVKNILQ